MSKYFENRLSALRNAYRELINQDNFVEGLGNGVFQRLAYPVITSDHVPLEWRYDMSVETNPFLMERFGINATFNAGAIKFRGKYILVVRVEGVDRKSFFAIAESDNGIDHFKFWDYPIIMPEVDETEANIYDMRLVEHQDGWIYGLFCSEKRDTSAPEDNQTAAIAQCGIARTKDLIHWTRLPNLKTSSPQQRNVVLHPEYVKGHYAFYTRPQDNFIEAGKGGGIGLGLSKDIEHPEITEEVVIDHKVYHTVNELKSGLGPAPIKTDRGWLHLAHGVRSTAAGLRYVLYLFMTSLDDITRVIHKPRGYFMAPALGERIGDVSNVLFSNGWILDPDGTVFIYYASADTRQHVAISTLDKLIDYVMNTTEDENSSLHSSEAVFNMALKNKNRVRRFESG